MNLHVTNDNYGFFPSQIAKRIKNADKKSNNLMVNLSRKSKIKDDYITYISVSTISFKNYLSTIRRIDKIIFHPYNLIGYQFLKQALKKFPDIKIYWVFWSYELYSLPHLVHRLYEPFSYRYVSENNSSLKKNVKKYVYQALNIMGVKKNYRKILKYSYSHVHFFCSVLPSDFTFFQSQTENKNIQYLPFSYLSLENIMPGLTEFYSKGDKIMIGHSSLPDGNHYEIIQKVSTINNTFSIFLPLAYGDTEYGIMIKEIAGNKFKKIEVLEEKLESYLYYQKLTEVGWAIINAKVQQGLGNIIALIWMGVKVFLDKNVSTYKDFLSWDIIVFSIQDHLNKNELSHKLTSEQMENNRNKILEKFTEVNVMRYWKEVLD